MGQIAFLRGGCGNDSIEIFKERQSKGLALNHVRGGVAVLGMERGTVAQEGEKRDENTQREVFHG